MSTLFVVPTPVGNLEDMTFRAIKVLKEAEFILCEDTRTSSNLCKHFDISTKLYANHKFNEHQQIEGLTQKIENSKSVALISDAGTPSISDPGYLIVKSCIDNGIEVVTLPGSTAFVPALVNSGFPLHNFLFVGFLPQKKGRQKLISSLQNCEYTMVFYESPHRILKALEQFIEFFGKERQVSISREISKIFEETVRGTLEEVKLNFEKRSTIKGEFVIVIKGLDDSKHKI